MKFAFVIFKYFPYGGAQRDMLRVARQCVRRGHQVHVYTLSWQGPPPGEGMDVEIIRAKGWANHRRYRDFIARVREKAAGEKFDALVGFNRMPGLDVYFAADPCFIERSREAGVFRKLSGRYRFFAECEEAVFGSASGCQILLLSSREQAIFQRWYGTQASRFHLVPPRLEPGRFQGLDPVEAGLSVRAEFGAAPDDTLLLLVGSGFRTKGLDRAIEGVAAMPSLVRQRVRLIAVGQDNPKPFIAQAQKLGLADHVKICGGRDDIPRLMHAADILVHPARSELAGHVLIEAMACGLPVLTTEVCGYAFHVAHANAGIVMPGPFEQSRFNERLQEMLRSESRAEWKENGKHYAQGLMAGGDDHFEAAVIETTAARKAERV